MSNLNKLIANFLLFMFLISPFIGCVTADGGIFGKSHTVFQIEENTQYAIINHKAEKQQMIISVNFDWEESNRTAWIFPIPSNPESVDIDIAGWIPVFSGKDLIEEAKDDLEETSQSFFAPYLMSVVIPYPIGLLYFSISGMMTGSTTAGVEIHTHIEKYGLVAEVISAKEGLGIYQYLKNNDMNISEGMITQFDEYVERDFSFVVSWLSNQDLTVLNPGIMIEFPTKNAFYPLILTSIYGNEVIPVDLIIIGYVSPDIYNEIEPYSDIKYWHHGRWSSSSYYYDLSPETYNFTKEMLSNWDKTFTSIEIEAPSNAFKKDLWIEDKEPDKVRYAMSIIESFGSKSRLSSLLFVYYFFSLLIAFILGIIILGPKKEDIPLYLIIGLGNSAGIIGLFIFVFIIKKASNKFDKFPPDKIALYLISFIITFIISMWLLFAVLMLPIS